MSIKSSFCALVLAALLIPVSDPSSQAPIGHRQPRTADIPANRSSADDDAWLNRVNRDIDSKLNICRGC